MGKVCCHGGAGITAMIIVGVTCFLVITGPLFESYLLGLGTYHGCSIAESVEQKSITGVCAMIYAIQGVYLLLVFCLVIISLLMCNGSLMCDFMVASCKEEDIPTGTSPRLWFREDGTGGIITV